MIWTQLSDRKPPLGRRVLVCQAGDRSSVAVMYLVTTVPIGEGTTRLSWYPGGLGIGHTTHWMELPEMPSAEAKSRYVWTGESTILEDGDGGQCIELHHGPGEAYPRCPVPGAVSNRGDYRVA